MQLSQRELLIRAKARARGKLNVPLDYEVLLKLMLGGDPLPTQRAYIESQANNKAFKGMAGVSKTSTLCASILLRALFQPDFMGAIGRYDYNKLLGTTYKRCEEMINRINPDLIIDRDKTPPLKWWIQQPGGGIAQIDFIGLKEYPGSYEWHRVAVDEADECELDVVEGLKSRLRAPNTDKAFDNDYGVDMVFNPPAETHWIYSACTGKTAQGKKVQEPTFTLFEPTPGENDANLPKNYYESNFAGLPPDLVDRLRWGKWGTTFPGEPVFARSFYSNVHVKDRLEYNEHNLLCRFWDFGFGHPACLWVSLDEQHRLRAHHEKLGENQEAKDFVAECLEITNTKFPRAYQIIDIGDPAAKQKKDTGSTLQVLEGAGINLMYLDGMTIEEGLRRMRYLFGQLREGQPMIQVSRSGCPISVRMFQGGYHKHKSTGRPVKDGFYDHIADAWRYGVTNLFDAEGRPSALPQLDDVSLSIGDAAFPDSIEYQD